MRVGVLSAFLALTVAAKGAEAPGIDVFLRAAQPQDEISRPALQQLATAWRNSWTPLLIDLARLLPPLPARGSAPDFGASPNGGPATNGPDAGDAPSPSRRNNDVPVIAQALNAGQITRQRLTQFLEKQTRQKFGDDLGRWRTWMWALPYDPPPGYAAFKATVYSAIDPRMAKFFPPDAPATIRLDEIDWGGVKVNGIPPLVYPATIPAAEATWLKDSNVVFGVVAGGEARAYPKRILAWHEMARDKVGGVELTVVYCTLCGTVLPYESVVGGKLRVLGTSGLLYRSNKLMFDEETNSLWSTLEGKPVVGALVGSGLELRVRSSVTTTWKEWRQMHPDTRVLSLETGFKRDYSEGTAYHDYFATDKIMFGVPSVDTRLRNKAEVLVTLLPGEKRLPVALSVEFLKKHPAHSFTVAGRNFLVVTTPDGANRLYDTGAVRFGSTLRDGRVVDDAGVPWTITEDELLAERGGAKLARVPANRAFWFGWYAQFPETILVK